MATKPEMKKAIDALEKEINELKTQIDFLTSKSNDDNEMIKSLSDSNKDLMAENEAFKATLEQLKAKGQGDGKLVPKAQEKTVKCYIPFVSEDQSPTVYGMPARNLETGWREVDVPESRVESECNRAVRPLHTEEEYTKCLEKTK